MLQENTPAPDFTLQDQNGAPHTLSQEKGHFVVIYFYPKDDTPGCTKEACGIRDIYADFKAKNVTVFGVSADSVESHKKFAEKFKLPFTLLADPEKKMIEAYGAAKLIGIQRMSYLINSDGMIAKVYPKVDPTTHASQILQDV